MGFDEENNLLSPLDNHPIFRRSELEDFLSRETTWDERKVVDEIDGVVIYKSEETFPSIGFYNETELKKARYQKQLNLMTVVQLKAKCKDLGLIMSGKKADLVERILDTKKGIKGVIYIDKNGRVDQPKWKANRRILLLHDDTEEVDQPGGGRLPYGTADVAFLRDIAMSRTGMGFLKEPGFLEPDVLNNIRHLPALLKQNRYDIVLISTHGGEYGLSGKGRSLNREALIAALKGSKGVGYLVISACNQAGTWSREYDDEDGWGYEEEDYATSIIKDCPVRCLTVSGEKLAASPENSLFLIQMFMSIMKGWSFSKSLSHTMTTHPKEGYQDIPMFYTHAGDPTFKLSKEK
jgi:hypothetical protein